MTRQTNNPRNTQQMDEAAMRELVANIRDQLAQLSDRMDVSEARLKEQMAASEAQAEERRQMQMLTRQLTNLSVQQSNPSLQQRNLDMQRQRNLDPQLQRNLDLQQRTQQPVPSLHQTNLDLLQRMQQLNSSLQRTNPSLQQTNLDLQRQRNLDLQQRMQQTNLDLQQRMNLAETQRQRTAAGFRNLDRRAQNTVTLHAHRLMATATPGRLAPLVSLVTGREIEGFPATFDDIAQINENDARRILADLEVATDGLSTAEMRDKIRSQVHYGGGQ
ncbi:hypothetical protein V8C40DRAFT_43486 [Trichoderma camerunense]